MSNANAFLEIILYQLAERKQTKRIRRAHSGKVAGVCMADDTRLLSCGHDRNVKIWDVRASLGDQLEDEGSQALQVYPGKVPFK